MTLTREYAERVANIVAGPQMTEFYRDEQARLSHVSQIIEQVMAGTCIVHPEIADLAAAMETSDANAS